MAPGKAALNRFATNFVTERHLATLSLPRDEGGIHVTPVGFTWDAEAGVARVITWENAYKLRLVGDKCRATICQVDGRHWLSIEGTATVVSDQGRCVDAERRYTQRYQPPRRTGDGRRVIEISVDRVIGSSEMHTT
ncbi:MAG: pyridoxamine 5'-phosphate oxidase family protein [Acidimicrobiales bacterium]